jgi:hypothetical protein
MVVRNPQVRRRFGSHGSPALPLPVRGGGGNVTWNPADTVNAVLSGGNLTATFPAIGCLTRATASHNSGKYYYECVVNSLDTGNNSPGIGVATAALTASGNGVWFPAAGGGCVYPGPTAFTNNGAPVDLAVPFNVADVFMIAVDITAGKVWFGRAGTWTNGGDPAAGTAQNLDITAGSTYFPAMRGSSAGGTARFKQSAWSFGAPAGFSKW